MLSGKSRKYTDTLQEEITRLTEELKEAKAYREKVYSLLVEWAKKNYAAKIILDEMNQFKQAIQ